MPASAGRVKMPHNNRMSTSGALKTSDIWSKTIGHDPYAADAEKEDEGKRKADEEKARGLMALARHQNVAGNTSSRDDFARKMYLGLKGGKKRRSGETGQPVDIRMMELLKDDSSSSEEEFVVVEEERKTKKSKRKSREDNDDNDSDDSEESRRRRKRRKRKKEERRRKKKKSRRKYESDSDDDSEESKRRRKKPKNRRRDDRKKKSERGETDDSP